MISAVVLAKNEEQNIERCLKSLSWVDELIVIDDASSDKTKVISQNNKARVISRNLNNDFSGQRNFALKQARGEWVFFVDADEEVDLALKQEIQNQINQKNNSINGYFFKRIDFFQNTWLTYGEISAVRLLRLARKNAGQWQRPVDETWEIKGKTKTFNQPLKHYPHQSLTEFLTSINTRSSLNAQVFFDQGKKNTFFDWFKPILKFKQNYFLRFGFLDKTPGLVFAILMSLHSFMVRAKLYLLIKNNEKSTC